MLLVEARFEARLNALEQAKKKDRAEQSTNDKENQEGWWVAPVIVVMIVWALAIVLAIINFVLMLALIITQFVSGVIT